MKLKYPNTVEISNIIYGFNNKPIPKLTVSDLTKMILFSDGLKDKLNYFDYCIDEFSKVAEKEVIDSDVEFACQLSPGHCEGTILGIYVFGERVAGFRLLDESPNAFYELSNFYTDFILKWCEIQKEYSTLFNRKGYEVWTYNEQKRQPLTYYAEDLEELKQLLSEEPFKCNISSYGRYRVVNLSTLTTVKLRGLF